MSHSRQPAPSSFKYSDPPNSKWTFGQKIEATPEGREWMEGSKEGWKTVDATTEDARQLYGLLVSGIAPRPVAFVSTISENGIENLAPYSWFNQVSAFPPVLSISCTRSVDLTRIKDTLRNIKTTKGFTVNIISEPWIAHANVCSIDAPEDIGEWLLSGLTKEPSVHVKASRVKESAFSMECELLQTIDIPDPATSIVATTLVLGSIKYIHVRNDVLNERGMVDPAKFKPVARMGGTLYARIAEGYHLDRHTWKEHETRVRELADADSSDE